MTRRLSSEEMRRLHLAKGEIFDRAHAASVRLVREATGAGMHDCKHALMACDYDVTRAIAMIPRIGLA